MLPIAAFFANIGVYLMPVYCIIFCINLVSILKKVKDEENTAKNTTWLTISLSLIFCSIVSLLILVDSGS